MHEIYMDNAATTAIAPEVIDVMTKVMQQYGNPSAIYQRGTEAYTIVEDARRQIAETLNCSPDEIHFTSGGSESDNWVIKGIADAYSCYGKHIITTSIEHKAILNSCHWLEKHGYEITYVDPDERGMINPTDIEQAIRDDTILVSVMTANNEIGTMEPTDAIGNICRQYGVLFHTDAVQAYGHIALDVQKQHIDLLSASGHKFHGPKGVGFLYVRKDVDLPSFIHGGGQENGLRAGTENVLGIAGMGEAARLANERVQNYAFQQMIEVRDYMIRNILINCKDSVLNGSAILRLPNNINMTFPGLDSSSALVMLSDMGICASAGSACNNGDPKPSHVLTAIGKTKKEAASTLRFTIGEETTKEDVDFVVSALRMIQDVT